MPPRGSGAGKGTRLQDRASLRVFPLLEPPLNPPQSIKAESGSLGLERIAEDICGCFPGSVGMPHA